MVFPFELTQINSRKQSIFYDDQREILHWFSLVRRSVCPTVEFRYLDFNIILTMLKCVMSVRVKPLISWIRMFKKMLTKCSVIWLSGSWKISCGKNRNIGSLFAIGPKLRHFCRFVIVNWTLKFIENINSTYNKGH